MRYYEAITSVIGFVSVIFSPGLDLDGRLLDTLSFHDSTLLMELACLRCVCRC